jgi:uncharacterized protein YbbC (DUF1343 family)
MVMAVVAVRTGAAVLLERPPAVVRGQRLGLVTVAGAVDAALRSTVDALVEAGRSGAGWRVTRLFGPEHGLRGDYLAGGRVPDSTDSVTGLPVSSLYGEHQKPTAAMLADVDVLVVDLPQIGVRFATKNATTVLCLDAAAEHRRPLVMLDRPNAIGGLQVEGPLLQPGFESFVGRRGQPIRYGMTTGEVARFANDFEGIGADLHVVQCEGWTRDQWWEATGLPWVLPSPNMPTVDTATVYPGTCLFEGTVLSEGRGTTRPFEIVGAPWIEPYRWAAALAERQLPGVRFRPLWFQPVASKHQGVRCGGVQLHVADRQIFQPVATGIHLLDTARALWPHDFAWRPTPDRPGANPFIDLLYGSPALRAHLDSGGDAPSLIRQWDLTPFDPVRQRSLLYL